MMGSTQFFWWVIRPDKDILCMRCFWAAKKVYLECILRLVWSLFIEIDLVPLVLLGKTSLNLPF
jgi:hypothetical protein